MPAALSAGSSTAVGRKPCMHMPLGVENLRQSMFVINCQLPLGPLPQLVESRACICLWGLKTLDKVCLS